MVEIFVANIHSCNWEKFKNIISKERLEKTNSFKFKEDRLRSILSELLLKYSLLKYGIEDMEIGYGKYGKPYLLNIKDFHYNITHSGDYVGIAISRCPIGLDIEIIDKKIDINNIMPEVFSEEEIEFISNERDQDKSRELFFELWTLKESYVKYTGEGLNCNTKKFAFQKVDGKLYIVPRKERLFFWSSKYGDLHYISLSSEKKYCGNIIELTERDMLNIK